MILLLVKVYLKSRLDSPDQVRDGCSIFFKDRLRSLRCLN